MGILEVRGEKDTTLEILRAPRKEDFPEPGLKLGGRFALKYLMEESNVGTIFWALDESFDAPCVVKVANLESILDDNRRTQSPEEPRNLARAQPPAPSPLGGGNHEGYEWYAMTPKPGIKLSELIEREEGIEALDALYIVRQIVRHFKREEDSGLWHRDVQAKNFHVDPDDFVRFLVYPLDYGSSYRRGQREVQYPFVDPAKVQPFDATPEELFFRHLNGHGGKQGLDEIIDGLFAKITDPKKKILATIQEGAREGNYQSWLSLEEDLTTAINQYENKDRVSFRRGRFWTAISLVFLTTTGIGAAALWPTQVRETVSAAIRPFVGASLESLATSLYLTDPLDRETFNRATNSVRTAWYHEVEKLLQHFEEHESDDDEVFPYVVRSGAWEYLKGNAFREPQFIVKLYAELYRITENEKHRTKALELASMITPGEPDWSISITRRDAMIVAAELARNEEERVAFEKEIVGAANEIYNKQYGDSARYLGTGAGVRDEHGFKRSAVSSLWYNPLLLAAADIDDNEKLESAARDNVDLIVEANLREDGSVIPFSVIDSRTRSFVREDDYGEGNMTYQDSGRFYSAFSQFVFAHQMKQAYDRWQDPRYLEAADKALAFGIAKLPSRGIFWYGLVPSPTPMDTRASGLALVTLTQYLNSAEPSLESSPYLTTDLLQTAYHTILQGIFSPGVAQDFSVNRGLMNHTALRLNSSQDVNSLETIFYVTLALSR